MQRRFSLQITLSRHEQTTPALGGLSQQEIKEEELYKAEDIGEIMLDEDRQSEHEISNYSFYHLNQDLYKKLSIQDYPALLTGEKAEEKEQHLQKETVVEQVRKRACKKNTKNSVQTVSSSQYGQSIMNDQSFRQSLIKIILQKPEHID